MGNRILVIGDTCLDVFVYGHCQRLCPEAPVPVFDTVERVENMGMAGNVYRNIQSIYPEVDLITNPNYGSISKTRYVDKKTNHMFIRIDSNEKIRPITGGDLMGSGLPKYEAVIISDYNKGYLNEDDIQYIAQSHPLTFLDTKKILGSWAKDVTFIKINRGEYFQSKQSIIENRLEDKVITTLGHGGCKYRDKTFPVNEVQVKDLSGAGDSFLAALVVEYIKERNIEKSLIKANEAATIVVQKMGVSLIKD